MFCNELTVWHKSLDTLSFSDVKTSATTYVYATTYNHVNLYPRKPIFTQALMIWFSYIHASADDMVEFFFAYFFIQ